MIKKYLLLFFVLVLFKSSYAQMGLQITPHMIHFMNPFDRIKNISISNNGNQPVIIDSMSYRQDYLVIRFNTNISFPFSLPPGETIKADIILSNYFAIAFEDQSQKIIVYSNSSHMNEEVEVEIDYYHHQMMKGSISGNVTDSLSPVNGANLYFFLEGIYLIDSTKTDQSGNYIKELPKGRYTFSVDKPGYYLAYYYNKPGPLNADFIEVMNDSIKTININLVKTKATGNAVSGTVFDDSSNSALKKALLVISKGTHNPRKSTLTDSLIHDVYSTFTKDDGSYSIDNISEPGYYLVQAYSNYYLPGYYNEKNLPAFFWQDADSVYISSGVKDKNIFLARDSSYGAGVVSGSISSNNIASLEGTLILAQSIDNGEIYNYNFIKSNGNFTNVNLPYGRYRMVAQYPGLDDNYSQEFIIDPVNDTITGINIKYNVSAIKGDEKIITENELFQNYPNPFNPSTNFSFRLASNSGGGFVTLKIYDVLGREVATLVNEVLTPGEYRIPFSPAQQGNATGLPLSSGVYIYKIRVVQFKDLQVFEKSAKLLFLK